MTTTTRDVSRLPQWAQHEINRLTRDVEYWKSKATEGPEDSRVHVVYRTGTRPLDSYAQIAFRWPDEQAFRGYHQITAVIEDDALRIVGDGSILVQPWAANVIKVRTDPHR
jgi:hypothetical protein